MTDRAAQRSPLAMMVLALLQEAPMHPYRIHELIQERGKSSVVNIAQRNSIYQTIERLHRAALVEIHATTREEGRPERVVYRATDKGTKAMRSWLETTLSTPAREFPEFPAALSIMVLLPPREVIRLLEARQRAVAERADLIERETKDALAQGLPRVFLIEDTYRQALLRAEAEWLDRTLAELRDGTLTWSRAWLKKIAADAEAAGVRPK